MRQCSVSVAWEINLYKNIIALYIFWLHTIATWRLNSVKNGTQSQLNIYRKFTKQVRQSQLSSHILFDTLCILCNFFVQKSRHQTTAPTSRPLNSVVTVKSFFLRIHKAHKSLVCYTLGKRDQRPCILASCISLWWNWLDVRSNLFLVKSFEGV